MSRIGSGGMGTVYVGEHTLIGRRAAIKVLLPELSQQREIIARFFNEARATAAIKHPGIVQIFDFGFAGDGSAYLVMELLDGKNLAAALRDGGPLPELDALHVIRQLARSISHAHAAGVIHRDLKPDNIFLLRDPDVVGGFRVKVLDFGVAKLSEAFETSKTEAGEVFGTPLYMAPEQFKGKVDERSDIYALGCVMFETLVGTPPFHGGSYLELLHSHANEPPAVPSRLSATLRPVVDAIVLRCLEKDPRDRFASMTELADELEHVLTFEGASAGRRDGSVKDASPAIVPGYWDASEEPSPSVASQTSEPTPTLLGVGKFAEPAGRPFGPYQLVRKIASGGMAEIYRATRSSWRRSGRKCARRGSRASAHHPQCLSCRWRWPTDSPHPRRSARHRRSP